jgi:hypothetical protein
MNMESAKSDEKDHFFGKLAIVSIFLFVVISLVIYLVVTTTTKTAETASTMINPSEEKIFGQTLTLSKEEESNGAEIIISEETMATLSKLTPTAITDSLFTFLYELFLGKPTSSSEEQMS